MLLTKLEHAHIFWHVPKNLFLVQDQCAPPPTHNVGSKNLPRGISCNFLQLVKMGMAPDFDAYSTFEAKLLQKVINLVLDDDMGLADDLGV